ncbi:MAG: hypothetical protein HDT43_02130 [Ruminococcaceae bacterium]|nr:hypothetical protein [Oscillospiraceae bacterium]
MDITAIIVAVLSLIGTLGGSLGGILVSSKLTAYRIEQLEKKVEEHNRFAQRMPLVEQRLNDIEQDVNELKQYHKPHN